VSAKELLIAAAWSAGPILLLTIVVSAAERRKEDAPGVYWVLMIVAFLVSGVVMWVVGKKVIE
jgi:hypothetical protein